MAVHGSDGLDEITTTGPTHVVDLKDGKVSRHVIMPSDVGIALARPEDLKGGDPAVNAAALTAVLDGARTAYRDIAVLNAAAALMVADAADDLMAGVTRAAAALDSGAAKATLARLVAASNA
jgi:anthranilate phosphoribosyltransferase